MATTMTVTVTVLVAAVAMTVAVSHGGCAADPLGKPCNTDDQCGPGFDCFHEVCVQVCTQDTECRTGSCTRYRCMEKLGREDPHSLKARNETLGSPDTSPPAPDPTITELRAIRKLLEDVVARQNALAERIDALTEQLRPPR